MSQTNPAPRKLSRQQLRAMQREKRDAAGWIAALNVSDPWMKRSIRTALGNRHVTRSELEEAIGVSLIDPGAPGEPLQEGQAEPERITVQHVLISFAGAGTKATRSREDAATLAAEALQRAQTGEDFGDLVRALTDDSFPGTYRLCNTGVTPSANDEFPRGRMVPAFGNVGFTLGVGEIGMSSFDPQISPYGWHIIKRLT